MAHIVVLCSGQGAQNAGMFSLLANAPEAEPVFKAAQLVLRGKDPREVVQLATDDVLHENSIGQVLCCTQAMAAWAVIRDKLQDPIVVAGYSVGELAAWGVAGIIDEGQVLNLAAQRAEAMDAATLEPSGLLAVHGLQHRVLQTICIEHGAYIAIVNAPDRLIVGGTRKALDAVTRDVNSKNGSHVTPIPVGVASHTPLLREASLRFDGFLQREHLRCAVPMGVRLLSGIDGDSVFDVALGAAKLARQIQTTVNWMACMRTCSESGLSKAIELGPGRALARMMLDTQPDVDVRSILDFHSLAGLRDWIG